MKKQLWMKSVRICELVMLFLRFKPIAVPADQSVRAAPPLYLSAAAEQHGLSLSEELLRHFFQEKTHFPFSLAAAPGKAL